jgi:hypothetical protein
VATQGGERLKELMAGTLTISRYSVKVDDKLNQNLSSAESSRIQLPTLIIPYSHTRHTTIHPELYCPPSFNVDGSLSLSLSLQPFTAVFVLEITFVLLVAACGRH